MEVGTSVTAVTTFEIPAEHREAAARYIAEIARRDAQARPRARVRGRARERALGDLRRDLPVHRRPARMRSAATTRSGSRSVGSSRRPNGPDPQARTPNLEPPSPLMRPLPPRLLQLPAPVRPDRPTTPTRRPRERPRPLQRVRVARRDTPRRSVPPLDLARPRRSRSRPTADPRVGHARTSVTTILAGAEPLRSPTFRRYLAISTTIALCLWTYQTSLTWTLLEATDSSAAVSLLQTLMTIPLPLALLPAGLLTDRFGARPMLVLAIGGYVLAVGGTGLLALGGVLTVPLALGFAFLLGIFDALNVVAGPVFVGRSVPPAQMGAAIGFATIGNGIGRIVGGPLGGATVGVFGPAGALLPAAAGLLFALLLGDDAAEARPTESAVRWRPGDLLAAFGWARRTPAVIALVALGASVALFMSGFVDPAAGRSRATCSAQGCGATGTARGIRRHRRAPRGLRHRSHRSPHRSPADDRRGAARRVGPARGARAGVRPSGRRSSSASCRHRPRRSAPP